MESHWYNHWPKGVNKHLDYPNVSLIELLKTKFEENADLPYLSILGKEFTYRTVLDQAARLAKGLQKMGVKKGDHVGLFMPNLPQYVVSFFGILMTGATVVPISPLYGVEDLRIVVENSKVKIIIALDIVYENLGKIRSAIPTLEAIITTELGDILPKPLRIIAKLLGKLPKSPIIQDIYHYSQIIKNNKPLTQMPSIDPNNDIAVIGYTGGTTGIPKGAMLTHKNLVANLLMAREWSIQVQPLGEHRKFVGAVPFFHIIGMTAVMLVTAYFDSTVYLFPDPRKFEDIMKAIEKYKIQYFHGVPTLFRALLNHPNFRKYDLSSLEIVFSGAAPLPDDLKTEFEKHIGGIMVEAYGMTETSPIIAANPFERENRKTGSIGIPFVDTDIKIIDIDTGKEQPTGESGELIVKGPQVMKGYYNNPEETVATIKEGYIHTGDIGVFDEEGFLRILSRKKEMIIASGYKIFPNEIEDLVSKSFPEINEVAVIGIPDEYRGESIKLIIELKENMELTKEKIVEFFRLKVAKYKFPKIIEFRPLLPKTTVGKIDKRTLKAEIRKLN